MKNAKAIKGQKALAMAVVAMFALCAFTVCIGSESDAGVYGGVDKDNQNSTATNEIFNVNISTSQTFTYDNIKTNLNDANVGTVTITGSPESGNGATYTLTDGSTTGTKKFTAVFSEAGDYTYTLTAKWTAAESEASGVVQNAYQTFKFKVYSGIDLPTSFFGYGIKGEEQKPMTVTYKGSTEDIECAISGYTEDGVTDGSALFDVELPSKTNPNVLTITPKEGVKGTEAKYGLEVTVKNTKSNDSDSVKITYQVFNEIIITPPENIYTYEGADISNSTIQFSTNWDTHGDNQKITYSITHTVNGATGTDIFTDNNARSTTFNADAIKKASAGTLVASSVDKATYTITYTATGTTVPGGSDGSQEASETKSETTSTLVIYKSLIFATNPSVGDCTITPITATNTSINLSSYITGAYKVVFDWGDGTQTSSMDNMGKTATTYGAYHTYAKAGSYTITVYATNDQGTTTSQVFHSTTGIDVPAGDADDTDKTAAETKDKSFIDEHGVQFIVFGILCILALVAFFYFGIQSPYVIIAAIILAALAVLCFVYHDIGGLIDAFRK